MQVWGRQSLTVGVLIAFGASLAAGIFLPVYTDEVGWRFQERAAFDGVDRMFTDICGPNSLATPPFFMMPARYFSAFFNGAFADPIYVRLSGIGYALLWTLLVLYLIARISGSRGERASLATVGFGLMGLGVLPLLLIWSRPEQPILLATTTALILACADWKNPPSETAPAAAWRRSLAILSLAIIGISYHFKAIMLIPLFLVCLVLASRGRSAHIPRLASGLLMAGGALVATRYWQDRVSCPADPILAAEYARANLASQLVKGAGLMELIPAMVKNVSLFEYVKLAVPSHNPMSQWLPAGQLTKAATWIWFRIMAFAWLFAALGALFCLGHALVQRLRQRTLDRKIILSVCLVGTAMAWSATQLVRNDYEASFVLPLIMLGFLFALSSPTGRRHASGVALLGASLGLLSIGSEMLVAKTFAPSLARSYRQEGYIQEQPFSVAAFGYGELKPDIINAAAQCRITSKARPKGLLIDDLTYFTFMHSHLPIHRLGVFSIWRGTITDPIAYLRSRQSNGIIAGCHLLSEDVRRRARRLGKFCCLGPSTW